MAKINKKCVECKQYKEQVFCKFDYNCEHERIQANERRNTSFSKNSNNANKNQKEKKINKSVSKCKGGNQSLMVTALTIF